MKAFLTAALLFATSVVAEVGDDGLHKAPWLRDTFKDLREDMAEAEAEGKRLMILIEQRGCIYCDKMHKEVFSVPEIEQAITDHFFVVQINMFGDVEVVDFDGTAAPEKKMVQRWNALFTPTMMFFPASQADVPADATAASAAVAVMPGAFGKWTTLNLLTWVSQGGYSGGEPFQKYHARKFAEQSAQN